MKKLEKEKKELLAARDDYIEKIESIRTRWVDAEKESETHNKELQEKWNNIETDYALTAEKLDTLSENRKELIDKAAFTAMLQQLTGNEDFLRAAVPGVEPASLCGKCGLSNNGNLFFCSYCGEPFMDNRPDIAGSLVETGELNGIYEALNSGIGETVSMIALFNGLNKGIDTFSGSVKKVKASEDKYPQLSKLRIDVPDFSLTFARNLQGVEKSIDPLGGSLHPTEFAEQLKKIISDLMTEENIERFFTDMGEELDRRTKEQWK